MKETTLTIRMDDALKKNMENVCHSLGINITTAITMFSKKLVKDRKMPFEMSDVMTSSDKILDVCEHLIADNGPGYISSYSEITNLLKESYGVTKGNIQPSDYCYNRINNGITINWPYFFEYLGEGKYRCLGEGYCITCDVYHKMVDSDKDEIVGKCINGERQIYKEMQ